METKAAHFVRVLAAKPHDLSLIHGTHMVKGVNLLSCKLSSDLHMCHDMYVPLYIHTK